MGLQGRCQHSLLDLTLLLLQNLSVKAFCSAAALTCPDPLAPALPSPWASPRLLWRVPLAASGSRQLPAALRSHPDPPSCPCGSNSSSCLLFTAALHLRRVRGASSSPRLGTALALSLSTGSGPGDAQEEVTRVFLSCCEK